MSSASNAKLEAALRLAERGFYVFRLKRNEKRPFAKGWQEEATTDPEEIHELFHNHDFNIGIFTGKYNGHTAEALAVVDVDTKDGKHGNATMDNLDILGFDFPPTYSVTTASGGKHLIYTTPRELSGGANKIGLHVDLKSHGGYVVGEGSTIDGKPYHEAPTSAHALHAAPEWIIKQAGYPMDRSALADVTAAVDTDGSIDRATRFIHEAATPASAGQRNDICYKTAAALHDFGVSEATAQNLMHLWNKLHCHPHLDIEEVENTTLSAYRTAKKSLGNASPHADFQPLPDDPKDKALAEKRALYFVLPHESAPNTSSQPLVEHFLDNIAVSILYGDSNTGKTFLALDIAFHIATGKPWNGHDTAQGAVAYLAAEGGRSALNRLEALKQHHSASDFPLALIPCQINLFDSNPDFKAFIALVHSIEAHPKAGPVRFIVIDTLSRALAGGNENDSQDMGEFVKNVTFIKEHFRAHVMVVHHSGKDSARGARGHSLLRAAVDTELEITPERTLLTRKQRDMEFAPPQGFELTTLTIGQDYKGRDITSCVVTYVDAAARTDNHSINRLDHRDLMAYLALERANTGRTLRGYTNILEQRAWGELCKQFDVTEIPGAAPWPQSDESFRRAFKRVRDRLSAFGRVEEVEEKQWAAVRTGQTGQRPDSPEMQ